MRRILILVVTALVATLTVSASALAQATTTTESFRAPFDAVLNPAFFACGGPSAEPIAFSGTFHGVIHTTENASGGSNLVIEFNTQDMTATGVNSGEPYRLVQVGKTTVTLADEGANETTVESTFNVISTGPPPNEPNYQLKLLTHLTITPDGEETATVVDARVECQG